MTPTATEISSAMSSFYKGQIIDMVIFLAFVVICCAVIFFGVKFSENMKRKHKILVSVLVLMCAVACLALAVQKFLPANKDYIEQSYTIETDAEIFVHEQSSNVFFDSYYDIELTTSSGEKINLKLYKSHSLSTNGTYRGTFVYTANKKALIWYSIASE